MQARLSKTPAEAYERGYMDGHAKGVAAERERCITAVFAWAHDAIDRHAGATFSAPTAAEQIAKRL